MKHLLLIAVSISLFGPIASWAQVEISGKVLDQNNSGINAVKIRIIASEPEYLQAFSRRDGSFKIVSARLHNSDIVSIKTSNTDYVPISEDEQFIRVDEHKAIVIHLVSKRLRTKTENEYLTPAMRPVTARLNTIREQLKQPNLSSAERSSLNDSLSGKKADSTFIVGTGPIYTERVFSKTSKQISNSLDLIKEGKLSEGKVRLFNTDDSIAADDIKAKIRNWHDKGRLATSLLNYEEAKKDFKLALAFDPNNTIYLLEYSEFLVLKIEDDRTALEVLKQIDSSSLKDDLLKSRYLNTFGLAYKDLGKIDQAKQYFDRGIVLAQRSNQLNIVQKAIRTAVLYNNIALIFNGTNDSLSKEYCGRGLDALHLPDYNLDSTDISVILNYNLASLYSRRGAKSISKKYYDTALKDLENRTIKTDFDIVYFAKIKECLAEEEFELNKLYSVAKFNSSILDTLITLNQTYYNNIHSSVVEMMQSEGSAFDYLGDHEMSLKYYLQALEFQKGNYSDTSIESNNEMGDTYFTIGNLYRSLGHEDVANNYFDSARKQYFLSSTLIDYQLGSLTDSFFDNKIANYLDIADYLGHKGNRAERLRYILKAKELHDKAEIPEKVKIRSSITIDNALIAYYYYTAKPDYNTLTKIQSEILSTYAQEIKNPFTTITKVAFGEHRLGNFLYDQGVIENSADLFKASISHFMRSLSSYEIFRKSDPQYLKTIADVEFALGSAFQRLYDSSDFIAMFKAALNDYLASQIHDSVGFDSENVMVCYRFIANYLPGNDTTSIQMFRKALYYCNDLIKGNPSNLSFVAQKGAILNEIGLHYFLQKQKDSSIHYFNESLTALGPYRTNDNSCLLCWIAATNNIAHEFSELGDSTKELEIRMNTADLLENVIKFDSLLKYVDSTNAIRLAFDFSDVGYLQFNKRNYGLAIQAASKALYIGLKYYNRTDDAKNLVSSAYTNSGYYEIFNGHPDSALNAFGLAMRYHLPSDSAGIQNIYINIIFAYLFENNLSKAEKSIRNAWRAQGKKIINTLIEKEITTYKQLNYVHKDFERLQEYIQKN